jgi:hypothetical protein
MLKVVHISGHDVASPKRLTAKQIKAQELELFKEELNRDRRKAAYKMIDQIKELIK